jgi:hypothetical protein
MSSRRASATNRTGVAPIVGAQVSPDLKRRLEAAADEHGTSISEEIRRRLEQSFLVGPLMERNQKLADLQMEGAQKLVESLSQEVRELRAALLPTFAKWLEAQQLVPERSAGHPQDTTDGKPLNLKKKVA